MFIKLWKNINAAFAVFFIVLIILSGIYINHVLYEGAFKVEISLPTPVIILAVTALMVAAFGVFRAYGLLEKKIAACSDPKKIYKRIVLGGALILLAFQLISGFVADLETIHDLKYVCQAAKNIVNSGTAAMHNGLPERHQDYFYVYPNNHLILVIMCGLYKIEYALFGDVYNILPVLLNIAGLNLSFILACKCAGLIYAPEKAAVCCVKMFFFSPLVSYCGFYYTDALSIPWITGAAYLYLKWRSSGEDTPKKRKWLYLLSFAAVLAVGFRLKTTPVIFLAAAVIDMIIRHKGGWKKAAAHIGALLCCFAAIALMISAVTSAVLDIDSKRLEQKRFPSVHWVMMSADGDGRYSLPDFYYTKSFDGYKNKVKADRERLAIRLSEMSIGDIAGHTCHKIAYTWCSGAFMSGYYFSGLFRSPVWVGLTAIFHFAALFGIGKRLLEGISDKNDPLSDNFVFRLTLMGITAFLIIWESKSRYLACFYLLLLLI